MTGTSPAEPRCHLAELHEATGVGRCPWCPPPPPVALPPTILPDTGSGHCCFAGCTLTTCSRCGSTRCEAEMHICPGPSAEVAAPALDERAYCDGCRALNWNTTCHGCADRMDNLIAERAAGHKEGYEEGQKDAIDKMAAGLRHRRDKDRNKVIRAALTILIDEIESGRSPS